VQTMSAILAEDPPPIDRSIPAPLRWAIDRCLAKEPADRYESTRDLYQELRHLRDHLSDISIVSDISIAQPPAAAVAASGSHRRMRWPILAVFAGGLVTAAVLALLLAGPQLPDQTGYRFTPF